LLVVELIDGGSRGVGDRPYAGQITTAIGLDSTLVTAPWSPFRWLAVRQGRGQGRMGDAAASA
jgi:hypothetical protein